MRAWILIAVVGTGTIALKGVGPLVIGGRSLRARCSAWSPCSRRRCSPP